ncbi:hypothetical protein ALC56_08792, partial [Trachymyrmex septentrionalis]
VSRTSNPAEVLDRKQSSSNYHWHDKILAAVSDMHNLLNKDLLDCDNVKFLSGQLLTNRGLCEARAAIRSYNIREREADVGETQCGNYYQCNGAAAVRLSSLLEKRFRFGEKEREENKVQGVHVEINDVKTERGCDGRWVPNTIDC